MKDIISVSLTVLRSCKRSQNVATALRAVVAHTGGKAAVRCLTSALPGGGSVLRLTIAAAMLASTLLASNSASDWVRQVELANALVESGDLDKAQTVYTKALEHALSAGDEIRVGLVLQNVGRLLDRKGRLREAEQSYLRAVSAFKRAGAVDERLAVRAYAGLSAVYIQTAQHSRAEALIRRVLSEHPAGADSDKASLMGSLAVILANRNQLAEAEQVLKKTVELSAGDSTDMQEVRAVALANLAGIQNQGGRTMEAVASYRQALSIMASLANPSPTTLSVALADYAGVLHGLDDNDAAGAMYRRAIATAQSRLGPTHPILGGLFQKYSELQRRSGNKVEARAAANAARRITDESRRENLTGHTITVEALMLGK